MMDMMSVYLLYGGVAVAGAAVAAGIVFIVVMGLSKRRLNSKLDSEYGKRQ